MEDQTSQELPQPKRTSRFKKMGHGVRSVLRGGEVEPIPGQTRTFLAILPTGIAIHVESETLRTKEDRVIFKEFDHLRRRYNIVTIPGKSTNTHVRITQDIDHEGKIVPRFSVVKSWYDSAINDTNVTAAIDTGSVADVFDVDNMEKSLVFTLPKNAVVSVVEELGDIPEGLEGTPEDAQDHEIKLVLDSFARPHIPEKRPDEATLQL